MYFCKILKVNRTMIKIEKQQVIEALKKITSPGEGGNLIDAEVVKNIVIFIQ